MLDLNRKIDKSVSYIRAQTATSPQIGLILGSGLGAFADCLENSTCIPCHDIPEFPASTVEGHDGEVMFGDFSGIPIVILRGRSHYYEGYSQNEITMPVRMMKKIGVESLILTNAAGGINLELSPGTLMLITDHINFSGSNPLIGINLDEYGPRFPDTSDIYTKELRLRLKETAAREGIVLNEGVYIMYCGPNYETSAEIQSFRKLGADAVGMSTVPEALVACHCGMKVLGISCIANMATGILDKKLSHNEVIGVTNEIKPEFIKLLQIAIKLINSSFV